MAEEIEPQVPPKFHRSMNPDLVRLNSPFPSTTHSNPLAICHPKAPTLPLLVLPEIRLVNLRPYDGPTLPGYSQALDQLKLSLSNFGVAIISLEEDQKSLLTIALESAASKMAINMKNKNCSTMIEYRAGTDTRCPSSGESSPYMPPGFPQVFSLLSSISRTCLSATAKCLGKRSDHFSGLVDDCPLPEGQSSSSLLQAFGEVDQIGDKGEGVDWKPFSGEETFFSLVALGSRSLLQIPSSFNRVGKEEFDSTATVNSTENSTDKSLEKEEEWQSVSPGTGEGPFLVLVLGGVLNSELQKGKGEGRREVKRQNTFQVLPGGSSKFAGNGASLVFHYFPSSHQKCTQGMASNSPKFPLETPTQVLNPASLPPVSPPVLGDLKGEASAPNPNFPSGQENFDLKKMPQFPRVVHTISSGPISLHSALCDPISGSLMEDATLAPCGHTFGGQGLKKLILTMVCPVCRTSAVPSSLVPNLALRQAVSAYLRDDRFNRPKKSHFEKNSTFQKKAKRPREREEQLNPNFQNLDDGHSAKKHQVHSSSSPEGKSRGVQFPFSVGDYVLIRGNKRTPEKFVGREAIITTQCLNGWYLVKTLDNGESVRLQYRSLQKKHEMGSPQATPPPVPASQGQIHPQFSPAAPPFHVSRPQPISPPMPGVVPPPGGFFPPGIPLGQMGVPEAETKEGNDEIGFRLYVASVPPKKRGEFFNKGSKPTKESGGVGEC